MTIKWLKTSYAKWLTFLSRVEIAWGPITVWNLGGHGKWMLTLYRVENWPAGRKQS